MALGMMGMGLAGFTHGLLNIPAKLKPVYERIPSLEKYYKGKVSAEVIEKARNDRRKK